MYVAYSALSAATDTQVNNQQPKLENERLLRYKAYQATCQKLSAQIAAVQKYIPGWMPEFK